MTIYCEGAAAAEVLFSLTGGREGRIVSVNPPVEIFIGAYFKTGIQQTVASDSFRIIQEFLLKNFNADSGASQQFDYQLTSNIEEPGNPRYPGKARIIIYRTPGNEQLIYLNGIYPARTDYDSPGNFAGILYSFSPITIYGNIFAIVDRGGILYAQEYPEETPTYEVNCKSCPEGLCAIRRYDEIVCIDCKKVISGINNASQKLDSIYG
jgi:hypothetical protein